MRNEFSKLRDRWAELFIDKLLESIIHDLTFEQLAKEAYKFADEMMREAGYDPDSTT